MNKKVDLLLVGGHIFNVYLKQFIPASIAITGEKISYVGNDLAGVTAKETRDISGKYVIPGLVDSHMHIQSSMMAPKPFSDAVLPHGVTTVISEPHEIANVFGLRGIEESMKAAASCQLDIRLAMPSSVPSTRPELETTGGEIGVPEIETMLTWPKTICLGEVMNMHDVIYEPHCKVNQIIDTMHEKAPAMPIEGHCPRIVGWELAAAIARGVTSDHTEQQMESMRQRLSNGVFVQLQKKSLAPDLLAYINEHHLEDRMAFVTDDTMPDALLRDGHLDQILRLAIGMGFPVEKAIYCATYTPSQRMRLFDRGALDPGKIADLVILDDLKTFAIDSVYKDGQPIKKAQETKASRAYPADFYTSVHLSPLSADDFHIPAPIENGTVTCPVALVQEHSTMTIPSEAELPVKNGYIDWESSPYALAAVFDRHSESGRKGYMLVGGNCMTRGAAASTYAHDHHNLLVLGQNAADMAAAANDVIGKQGGMSVADHGQITGAIRLPVAGILSEEPIEILGQEAASFKSALMALGYHQDNPIMSMTTLGLPVSPAMKVTDRGIIDVKTMSIIPFVKEMKK